MSKSQQNCQRRHTKAQRRRLLAYPEREMYFAFGEDLFFKPFGGSQPTANYANVRFSQDNAALPGAKYTLSAYAAAEDNYCGRFNTNSPAPQTLLVVQFLNSGGTVLASNAFDLQVKLCPN